MDNKGVNEFYDDICNLGRVLPNLAPSLIYRDLNDLRDKPNRVELILKKYFCSYDTEVNNCMSDDIKKIKRVLPNYPVIHISNDLSAVADKDNRVQLVLRDYFENQQKNSKRALDDNEKDEANLEKKIKIGNDVVVDQQIDVSLEQNYLIQISTPKKENYVLTDEIDLPENVENAGLTGQKTNKSKTNEYITLKNSAHLSAIVLSPDKQQKEEVVEINQATSNQIEQDNSNILSVLSSLLQDSVDVFNGQNQNIATNNNSVPLINTSDNSQPTTKQIAEINNDLNHEDLCSNENTIQFVLTNLFPQFSLDLFKTVSESVGFNLNDPPYEEAISIMVQMLLNYDKETETLQPVECDSQISLSTFVSDQNNEKNITREHAIEHVNITPVTAQNNNLLSSQNSSEEGSTESYDGNNEFQNSLHVLKTCQQHKIDTCGSQVLASTSSTSNSETKLTKKYESEENNMVVPTSSKTDKYVGQCENSVQGSFVDNLFTEIIHRDSDQSAATNSTVIKPATFQPMANAVSSNNTVATSSTVIKPATFQPMVNAVSSNNTDINSRSAVMKPATFHPKTKTVSSISNNVVPQSIVIKTKSLHPTINTPSSSYTGNVGQRLVPMKSKISHTKNTIESSKLDVGQRSVPMKSKISHTKNTIESSKLDVGQPSVPMKSKISHTKNTIESSKLDVGQRSVPMKSKISHTKKTIESSKLDKLAMCVIKPATFQPKTNTKLSKIEKKQYIQALHAQMQPWTADLAGLLRTTDSLPSTSGLQNSNVVKLTAKNSIRVRTDLYDMYFNGPTLKSNSDSSNENNNDDVIFVSAGHVSENDPSSNISYEDNVQENVGTMVEENSNDSGKQTTVNIQNCIDIVNQPSELQTTHPYYFKLLEIFPDICPDYLKKFCSETTDGKPMDELISILLCGDYQKRDRPKTPESNLEFEEQHKLLQDLFPDADPSYLQHHCERLIDHPQDFKLFVSTLLENKSYPTKAEYLKKLKLSAQEKQYTTEFSVEKFLEVIPNPEEYFKDPKRQVVSQRNFDDIEYAITFLKNKFCTCSVKDITTIFKKTNYSVIHSTNLLETFKPMKTKRRPYPVTSCKNIPLLQEIAYVKNKDAILAYIKKKELEKNVAREQAKSNGLLKCCQCCFDEEIMPEDIETCQSMDHIFCKDCIRRGCEVIIGDGKLEFPCLANCGSFFTLQVLQTVLSPKVFSKMALRKQLEEVKSAGIEDLESCPFCDFATIPAPGDKIFRCLNDDCMKESCRLCKEESHIPLRCDEVEKDKDVKMRTYIENKMTEALLRKCYKCGLKFIKESGCNKMTCSCGAMMCYVCNKPVQDYKHFNGQGGDQYHLCPLYSDTHKLHMDAVKQSAQSAMEELGVDNNNQLKIDPTTDLEQHYSRLAQQEPVIPQLIAPPNIIPL